MSVSISPVGLAAAPVANQLSALATYKEKLRKPYCSNNNMAVQTGITYTADTPTLVGTTVFVPITASVSILSPGCCNSQNPQGYTETFEAAFQGQTDLPTAVTITSVGRTSAPACIDRFGRVNGYVIYDSITIAITT